MSKQLTLKLNPETLVSLREDYNFNSGSDYSAIAYGVDGDFLIHAGVSIISIIENMADKKIHFIIITDEVNHTAFAELQSVIEMSKHALSIVVISDAVFDYLPKTHTFPSSIYYRLLAPIIFQEYLYLLYVDADIVALNDLSGLLDEHKPGNVICCVVKEPGSQMELSRQVGVSEGEYFNSGVIYINNLAWMEHSVSERVYNLLIEKGDSFLYFDQDALNMVLNGKVFYLNQKYNMQIKAGHKTTNFLQEAPVDTVFLHYVGEDKPWQIWNTQNIAKHYRKYRQLSPWGNISLASPNKSKELKKYYKSLWFQRQYFLTGVIYMKYQWKRFFYKDL